DYSGGRNLMVRVLYAQFYARLTFDQPLHDKLLNEVLAADPVAPQLTLVNTLAKRKAKALLESGKDYFLTNPLRRERCGPKRINNFRSTTRS
ncbi:MAG TPA: TRAP transporter TatT component family protein, partial [Rudaea sp.]